MLYSARFMDRVESIAISTVYPSAGALAASSAAMMVFAVLKKLLKMAVIVAIAAGLYLLLVEYLGGGL